MQISVDARVLSNMRIGDYRGGNYLEACAYFAAMVAWNSLLIACCGREVMLHVDDIYSLTDFQRHAKEHIERLKQTGRPEVLTVNGKAELVVQDAEAYQKLLDLLDRAEALEGIR